MSDIVSPLLQWLNANPQWAGFVTFLISASESVAIIGTIVPGSITMTAIGALAGAGVIPIWETIIWAILGAIVGDGISYWMGFYFKKQLPSLWPFRNNPGFLQKGEIFVHKYGVMSVFIGRFVGPVRALVPMVAGMLGMRPWYFTIANVTSAILWAPVYMLPGIMLGAASLELPPDIAIHVMLVLLLIILFILLCLWVTYKILQLISNQIDQYLIALWNYLKKSRYFSLTTILLKHHDPEEHHGQLVLAFYFLLTTLLLIALIAYVKMVGANHILVNDALYHFFRGIRNSNIDNIMITITLFGQKEVILPMVGVLFLWLLINKRARAALHLFSLAILAAGSIFLLKHISQSVRPWGIFSSPETFSMPSGHATLSATIYLGIAFLIALPLSPKRRWLIYWPAGLLAFAVAMSRLYLGAHWFTDILAAWLLSAALVLAVMMSFNRYREKPIRLLNITLVCLLSLACSYGIYYYHHFSQLKINYTKLDWPTAEISMTEWWQKDESIPAAKVSLFGFPSQEINIQWVGNLDDIKATLFNEGWSLPPARNWISTLHRISDIKSSEYLPLISPQYLDKKPALILAKRINGSRKLLVLRLWESSRIIKENKLPLWVGTVGVVPRSYSWIFRKHKPIDLTQIILMQSTHAQQKWEWRFFTHHEKTLKDFKILLIREKK